MNPISEVVSQFKIFADKFKNLEPGHRLIINKEGEIVTVNSDDPRAYASLEKILKFAAIKIKDHETVLKQHQQFSVPEFIELHTSLKALNQWQKITSTKWNLSQTGKSYEIENLPLLQRITYYICELFTIFSTPSLNGIRISNIEFCISRQDLELAIITRAAGLNL